MNAHTLWYITRATGIVALVVLTASTVLGIVTARRFATERWPRFAWQDLHRRLSLVAVVFIGLHVASTVADGYAPIGWLSAFVPFSSPYRRLWLGFGTAAVDLLLAVGITSVLRARIRQRTWRAVHWLGYASWPLAVVHALGTGTDPRLHWVVGLVVLCAAAVVGAGLWRLADGWPARAGLRAGIGSGAAASVLVVGAWAAAGPLRPGWAAKAGTPASMLHSAPASSTSARTPTAPVAGGVLPAPPFTDTLSGTVTERNLGNGAVSVELRANATGAGPGVLDVVLQGAPDGNGGLVMQSGQATFGPANAPTQYSGQVVGLSGSRIDASVADASGTVLALRIDVALDGSSFSGTLGAGTGFGAGDDNR